VQGHCPNMQGRRGIFFKKAAQKLANEPHQRRRPKESTVAARKIEMTERK
jgi:hypothetical protein